MTCRGNGGSSVDGVGKQSLLSKKGKGVERTEERLPAPLRSGQVRTSLLPHLYLKVQTCVRGADGSELADVLCLVIMSLLTQQTFVADLAISFMAT